jgi:cell wall-associated NlpC family hydrolase
MRYLKILIRIISLFIALLAMPLVSLASGSAKLASNLGKYMMKEVDTVSVKSDNPFNSTFNASMQVIDGIVDMAQQFIGVPYVRGGASISGFDCSGFVSHLFKNFGILVPRSSKQQAQLGSRISKDEAQKGDLLFFKGHGRRAGIGHVALVISNINGELKIAHATNTRGVVVELLDADKYFLNRFIKAVRVNYLNLLPIPLK